MCGDYKVVANQAALVNAYPLPRIEDLFASLSGGTTFLKFDLDQDHLWGLLIMLIYSSLNNSSKPLTTINTHRDSSSITACLLGSLQHLLFVREQRILLCYLDDILVTGSTEESGCRH